MFSNKKKLKSLESRIKQLESKQEQLIEEELIEIINELFSYLSNEKIEFTDSKRSLRHRFKPTVVGVLKANILQALKKDMEKTVDSFVEGEDFIDSIVKRIKSKQLK